MSVENGDHLKLFQKIDDIHHRIDEIREEIHKLTTNVAVLAEKHKQVEVGQKKITYLEGKLNTLEGDIGMVRYQSSLIGTSKWDKVMNFTTQLSIIVLVVMLLWKVDFSGASIPKVNNVPAAESKIRQR